MKEVTISSFGKINLSLNVTGARADGYHTIETVMQKISLRDLVTVRWLSDEAPRREARGHAEGLTDEAPRGIEISLKSNRPYLPCDGRNIAYKAAALMTERFGGPEASGRIEIYLKKNIPVSAGLAGGSGNGAAVIGALNRLWGLKLNVRQMCALGGELGADVPFCVLIQNSRYGCALGTGTGTELRPVRSRFRKFLVLAKPAFGISTREVYGGIDDCRAGEPADTEALIKALSAGDERAVYGNMMNRLEDYTLDKYKEVLGLKNMIGELDGAEKVLMTGSGPTVFGLFSGSEQAREACRTVRKAGYEAYWARTL